MISSLTFANTNYIRSSQKSPQEAREILRKFKVLINSLNLDNKIVELALSDHKFPDFEDGLQYYSALENNADVILALNKRGFKKFKNSSFDSPRVFSSTLNYSHCVFSFSTLDKILCLSSKINHPWILTLLITTRHQLLQEENTRLTRLV